MAFGHPDQHQHKVSGIKAAIASKKTPAHLKPHLQKQLENNMKAKGINKGAMTSMAKMDVESMGAPGDPAQQPRPIPSHKKKFQKGAAKGKNKGKLKVQGVKPIKRNPLLGDFPSMSGSGPDDDGY